MKMTCSKCGAPLGEGQISCPLCGTQRNSAAPGARVPRPGSNSGSAQPKLVVVIAFLLCLALLGMGSRIYSSYRAKKKVEGSEKSLKNQGIASTAPAPQKSAPVNHPAALPPVSTNAPPKFVQVSGPETERTEGGPEADLVVRTGDINNLGFDWPKGFDPFSGESTPPHPFPWTPPPGSPDGTDRLMIGSAVTQMDYGVKPHDGYSTILRSCCGIPAPNAPPSQARQDSMPRPITLDVGALPAKIDAVLFQIFVDDFQAPVWHSHFQVTLNGTRIPSFEDAINALDQTGPIGKLVSLRLLPEYWPLLQSGTVKLLIDDPTTRIPDGYAIDFVRILVNPHKFKYEVSLAASVVDADKHSPIAGATVTAALVSTATDRHGKGALKELPAGLVVASASAPGYDADSVTVDLVAGQTGKAEFQLHRHEEGTAALERAIAQTGSATIYGIHFDTGSAKLRPDSAAALASILGLINGRPGSRWSIAGHTDNQGGSDDNLKLSEARAGSVVAWLSAHGVEANRLVPKGFGASRPVADNASANGRALNRRVEIAPAN
jgi:OOP family OmpA-OmpF porin